MSRDACGDEGMIWGLLLHLGYNMWCDREAPEGRVEPRERALICVATGHCGETLRNTRRPSG